MNELLEQIRRGGFVAMAATRHPDAEVDLVLAGEYSDVEHVNTMATLGGGIIHVCLPASRCVELGLHPQAGPYDARRWQTAATVSVEATLGTTTGISAGDRSHTVLVLAAPETVARDIVRPGHVFPLAALDDGVFVRLGGAEAAVDLMRLASCQPVAAVVELLTTGGERGRVKDLEGIAPGTPLVTFEDVLALRMKAEPVATIGARTILPTTHGTFEAVGFRATADGRSHLALVFGDLRVAVPAVSVQTACLVGEVLTATVCDCSARLDAARAAIVESGCGVVISLEASVSRLICPRTEPRAGLPAAALAAAMLRELGVKRFRPLDGADQLAIYGLSPV